MIRRQLTQSGAAMLDFFASPAPESQPLNISRNAGQWHHIADFLSSLPSHADQAKRSAEGAPPRGEVAGRAALSQPLPDGNHGENLNEAQA